MRRGSSTPPASKSWNLMLDDPALSTRYTEDMAHTSGRASFARWASATRDATAQDARRVICESARLVRMMGTRAPSTIPAASASARKVRLLASMLPASRLGTTRTLACTATGDRMFLIWAAPRSMALSRASGPSRMPPVIWPRSAILQSAAASMVDGTFGFTVSMADRMATRTVSNSERAREVDGVLDDVDLVREGRGNVDRRIGHDEGRLMARHVHDEAMADPARRPQATVPADDSRHELVRVQAAFHQRLSVARLDERDSFLGRGMAMESVDDAELREVCLEVVCGRRDFVLRPDEDRVDEPERGGFERSAKRGRIAGMRHS